jgi:hypothetical protein
MEEHVAAAVFHIQKISGRILVTLLLQLQELH